jgi:hypothetical protein
LINFWYKFDQVFDVMLHTVSPPRREAASPVLPPQLHSQSCSYISSLAVTNRIQGLRPTLYLSGGSFKYLAGLEVLGQAFRGVGCDAESIRSKSEVAGVGPARWCCISLKTVFKKLDFCPKSSNRTEARQRAWIGQIRWMHSRLVGRCSSSWAC